VLPEVFPSLEGVFAPSARVVQFDLNGTELAKNFPASIAAIADPKQALALLAEELGKTMTPDQLAAAKERIERQRAVQAEVRRRNLENDASSRDEQPLRASRFFEELARRMPTDAVVFDEALTHSPELGRYVPQDVPGTYFQTRAGMLGTGLPGAVGLKLAYPDRVVFGFSGDGGSISTIQALATAARYNIGAKFVVCNNRSSRILKYNLADYRRERGQPTVAEYPESFDLDKPELRFDLLANGQGVDAVRVECAHQIGPALNRALQDDRPFLIDLVLSSAL
jgi:benzoylformate decarboxylase